MGSLPIGEKQNSSFETCSLLPAVESHFGFRGSEGLLKKCTHALRRESGEFSTPCVNRCLEHPRRVRGEPHSEDSAPPALDGCLSAFPNS